jgi:hypothetical protein
MRKDGGRKFGFDGWVIWGGTAEADEGGESRDEDEMELVCAADVDATEDGEELEEFEEEGRAEGVGLDRVAVGLNRSRWG